MIKDNNMQNSFIAVNLETKFKKGDKLICTDDDFHPASIPFFDGLPEVNNTYTVRDSFTQEGKKVVLLEEIKSNPLPHPHLRYEGIEFFFEPAFSANRFEFEEVLNKTIWVDF